MPPVNPIKITKEEYEKKFGISPVTHEAVELDITPAPIRITRAEYDAMFRPEKKGFFADAKQDFLEMGQAVDASLTQGAKNRSRIVERAVTSDTSLPKETFRLLGSGLKTGGEVALNSALGFIKMALPQGAEQKVADFLKAYANDFSTYAKKDLERFRNSDKPEEQNIAKFIDDFITQYNTNQEFKDDVDAAGGFANAILSLGGGRIASKGVTNTFDTAGDVAKSVTPAVANIAETIKAKVVPTPDQRVTAQANDILKVEEKYQGLRNANAREGASAEASRQRIAQSNVLEGAVDENGLIDTTEAVKIYRAATIDGYEGKVRQLLDEEGKSVNLNEIRNALRANILDSGLEGAALSRAISGIEQQIKGLSLRADPFGNVPLAKLQDAKIAEYNSINFKTGPNTAKYKKTIARTYKEIIENKSNQNIKEINEELSKFYQDIDRLERLNGKRVEGGRLGRYGAQVVGSVAGAAGGSVGGGFGAMVGGLVGGELASKLKGVSMARTFKRGIDGKAPDNSVLKGASLKVDLKTPDKKVGIPAGIKATPEMKKVEAQIARNVELQKKAIKANDFTLVAQLKEIYVMLVNKLKALIEDYKKNGPPIGLSIRKSVTPESVAKNADREDIRLLAKVIDDPSLAKTDPDVKRILSNMGLGRATEDELVRFAKEVIDESEGVAGREVIASGKVDPRDFKSAEEYVEAYGTPVYHGTNKNFDTFDISKQKRARNESLGGGEGIYFTPDENVAKLYARASANANFDTSLIKELAKSKPNSARFLEELITKGESTWDNKTLLEAVEKEGVEPNHLYDISQYIEGSKTYRNENVQEQVMRLLGEGAQTLSIPEHVLKKAKSIGITLPSEKTIQAFISPNAKILKTSSRDVAKNAKGYDVVILNDDKTVNGIPEYIVKNPSVIKTRTQLIEEWNKANQKNSGRIAPIKLYHGSANKIKGDIKPSSSGILGAGFYMTQDPNVAKNFAKMRNIPEDEQTDGLQKEVDSSITPILYSIDTSDINFLELKDAEGLMNYLAGRSVAEVREKLIKEGYDGIALTRRGEMVVFPEKLNKIKIVLED